MVEVAVKSKLSVLIRCFLFQQRILFYKNLTLLGQDIFSCIQSKDNAFQLLFCDCILLFYRNGNLLSFIFIGNPFVNHCLGIILCGQGKFLLFRIQYEMVACHRFFQIIRTQWKIVHYCFSFFICDQGCYQIIFFITDDRISLFIPCSVWRINRILGVQLKGCPFHAGFFIYKVMEHPGISILSSHCIFDLSCEPFCLCKQGISLHLYWLFPGFR